MRQIKIVRDLMNADAVLPGLIAGVYSAPAPDVDGDYITLDDLTSSPINSLEGDTGKDEALLQLDIWSTDASNAVNIADKVRALLNCSRQTINGSSVTIHLENVRHDSEIDERDGAQTKWFRISQDYKIIG